MKTLTTLTAVAALVAGLSIASAQTTTPKSGAMGSSSSSSSMGTQQQASGSGKFCIETSAGGSLNCKYASLAACQKDAKAQNLNCSPNPNSGTTGAK